MSWRELSYLLTPRAVLIVGMLLLPLVMPSMYWQRVISIVCIYALLALSFDFLAHYVGLVSLGGAFFIGTGGYLAAILNTSFGLPFYLTIPIATLVGAVICTGFLLPCLPLRAGYTAAALGAGVWGELSRPPHRTDRSILQGTAESRPDRTYPVWNQ